MSAAFFCVQFRNLLPSEQPLLFARTLWSGLQQRGTLLGAGDATLSITQRRGDGAPFEVELTVAAAPRRGAAADADVLVAIEKAFAKWEEASPYRRGDVAGANGQTATAELPG